MSNLHFIFGADEFFVELRTKKLLADYIGFSVETIDEKPGSVADLKRVLGYTTESLQTMDFFSENKCVWLKATHLLNTYSPATSEEGQICVETWLNTLKNLPQDVHLVISASPVDKRTRFFKALRALAVCEEIEEKYVAQYLRFLIKKLSQELKIELEQEAYELLVQKLNYQPRAIVNEVEKLACFKNFTGCITKDDVLNCTPTFINDTFFEPIDAFYEKNESRYVRSLRHHFILYKEMRSVLTSLQNRNRLLIQLTGLQLPSISKTVLESSYKQAYITDFGKINDKNTFCVFSQNPWYLSHLKNPFNQQILMELQSECVKIFDYILEYPQHACASMETLVRFF